MFVVTGAAGFIGSALVWELNSAGVKDIICVDELGSGPKWKNLNKRAFAQFIQKEAFLELLDRDDVIESVEAIFHMGACSSTTETDVDFLMQNNVAYSQTLLEWCTAHQKPFIYASSCATYGSGDKGFDDQTSPFELEPLNPYGFSKVIFDRWVTQQAELPPQCVGLKFSNVFGPQEYHKDDQASVVYKSFHQVVNEGKVKLFKSYRPEFRDGMQSRDFVYIKDITRWIWEIYNIEIPSGIYNLGSGESRTWTDLATAVFKATKRETRIEFIDMPEQLRDQYQYFTQAKIDRLLKHGLSRPQWNLEKGIEDFVRGYLSQKDLYL